LRYELNAATVARMGLFGMGTAVVALVASACAFLAPDPSPETEPTVPVVMRDVRSDMRPLSQDQCNELAGGLKELGAPVSIEMAPFQDQIAGNVGEGCLVSVSGTGVQFESPQVVADRVTALLSAQSWQEDKSYSAAGPAGVAMAFRKDTALCLFSVSWWPEGMTCPSDRPLSECAVPPEKKLYQIELQCAQ
jgi:hypothetical protein